MVDIFERQRQSMLRNAMMNAFARLFFSSTAVGGSDDPKPPEPPEPPTPAWTTITFTDGSVKEIEWEGEVTSDMVNEVKALG